MIWAIEGMSKRLTRRAPIATAPEDELQQLAELSAEEGSIMAYEADLVRHALELDKVTANKIMTPISVVVTLPNELTLAELRDRRMQWNFSRIPIHDPADQAKWTGFVLSRDVLSSLAMDRFDVALQDLAKPLHFVRYDAPAHKLLKAFLKRRTHMFAVVDRHERVVGVVTLEDVLESLIGFEIVDELDPAVDMQRLAKTQRERDP